MLDKTNESELYDVNIILNTKMYKTINVSKNTDIRFIRSKIPNDTYIIHNGNIITDDNVTLESLGIIKDNSNILAFYSVYSNNNIVQKSYISILTDYVNSLNNIVFGQSYTQNNLNITSNNTTPANNALTNTNSYDEQLELLSTLGYTNIQENIRMLNIFFGDVNAVVDYYLG